METSPKLLINILVSVLCFFPKSNEHVLGSDIFANFIKSKVIDYSCDFSWKLGDTFVTSLFDCALRCSEDKECRRFFFSESTSLCILYGEGANCALSGSPIGSFCYQKTYGRLGSYVTCPIGHYGDECQHIALDCEDAKQKSTMNNKRLLVTNIQPHFAPEPFEIRCWTGTFVTTTILSNDYRCPGTYYNRTLKEYEEGFGSFVHNSWLGFSKLSQIMNMYNSSFFLRLVLKYESSNITCYAVYHEFKIGNATEKYALSSGIYSDNKPNLCGNSLTGEVLNLTGRPFSTYDQDYTSFNCPVKFGGGWWFADDPNCTRSFLMTSDARDGLWLDYLNGGSIQYYRLNFIRK